MVILVGTSWENSGEVEIACDNFWLSILLDSNFHLLSLTALRVIYLNYEVVKSAKYIHIIWFSKCHFWQRLKSYDGVTFAGGSMDGFVT